MQLTKAVPAPFLFPPSLFCSILARSLQCVFLTQLFIEVWLAAKVVAGYLRAAAGPAYTCLKYYKLGKKFATYWLVYINLKFTFSLHCLHNLLLLFAFEIAVRKINGEKELENKLFPLLLMKTV